MSNLSRLYYVVVKDLLINVGREYHMLATYPDEDTAIKSLGKLYGSVIRIADITKIVEEMLGSEKHAILRFREEDKNSYHIANYVDDEAERELFKKIFPWWCG